MSHFLAEKAKHDLGRFHATFGDAMTIHVAKIAMITRCGPAFAHRTLVREMTGVPTDETETAILGFQWAIPEFMRADAAKSATYRN